MSRKPWFIAGAVLLSISIFLYFQRPRTQYVETPQSPAPSPPVVVQQPVQKSFSPPPVPASTPAPSEPLSVASVSVNVDINIQDECESFNLDKVVVLNLHQEGNIAMPEHNEYIIAEEQHPIFGFGLHAQAAQDALAVIRYYRANQRCFVAVGNMIKFQYLLSSGNAPAGPMTGEDCAAFNLAEVPSLFDLGGEDDLQHRVSSVISKHQFDHVCYVGRESSHYKDFRYLRK